jgi:geranylgeranyl pyrophosphate synthase
MMEKHGSIEYAEKTAKKYSNQAKNIFTDYAKSLKNTRAKEIIYSCIDFVVNRNR